MEFKYAGEPADRLNKKMWQGCQKLQRGLEHGRLGIIKFRQYPRQKDEKGNFKYDTPIYVNQTYPWANYESVKYHTKRVEQTCCADCEKQVLDSTLSKYQKTGAGVKCLYRFRVWNLVFYLYVKNGERVGYVRTVIRRTNLMTDYLKEGRTQSQWSLCGQREVIGKSGFYSV